MRIPSGARRSGRNSAMKTSGRPGSPSGPSHSCWPSACCGTKARSRPSGCGSAWAVSLEAGHASGERQAAAVHGGRAGPDASGQAHADRDEREPVARLRQEAQEAQAAYAAARHLMTCRVQAVREFSNGFEQRAHEAARVSVVRTSFPALEDMHELLGALRLYAAHDLPTPLVAPVFAPDDIPVVSMVGWSDTVAGEEVAVLARIVGNPDFPPGLGPFAPIDRRWSEVGRAAGLMRTVTFIERERTDVASLAWRYRFTPYAEDDKWRWYVREEV